MPLEAQNAWHQVKMTKFSGLNLFRSHWNSGVLLPPPGI